MKWLNDGTKGRIQHYNNVIIIVKSAVGLVTVCKSIYVFFYAEVCVTKFRTLYTAPFRICVKLYITTVRKNWIRFYVVCTSAILEAIDWTLLLLRFWQQHDVSKLATLPSSGKNGTINKAASFVSLEYVNPHRQIWLPKFLFCVCKQKMI